MKPQNAYRPRIKSWSTVGLLLLLIGLTGCASSVDAQPAADVTKTAPDFTLTTLDGRQVTLSEYRGQPVLLNFWASWCTPCKEEMAALMRAQAFYADEGLVILTINMTFDDSREAVTHFVAQEHLTLPVLLDEQGTVTRPLYRVVGVPTSVFISAEGVIIQTHLGAMSEVEIFEAIAALM